MGTFSGINEDWVPLMTLPITCVWYNAEIQSEKETFG